MRLPTAAVIAWNLVLLAPVTAWAADSGRVKIGDKVPSFIVDDDEGQPWNSEDHVGKKILVMYFYPADMTGGCTAQACSFRDDMGTLADADVEVVGISGDSVENHQKFKKAHRLNFTLLADVDGKVADLLGVPKTIGERIVNKTIDGIDFTLTRQVTTKRWTFIFDRSGRIAYIDDSVKAKVDSQTVANAIAKMKSS
ncbi:MAG: peroxiredoxin [Planctomycetota bacterium]